MKYSKKINKYNKNNKNKVNQYGGSNNNPNIENNNSGNTFYNAQTHNSKNNNDNNDNNNNNNPGGMSYKMYQGVGEGINCMLGSLVKNVANFGIKTGKKTFNLTKKTTKAASSIAMKLGRKVGAATLNLGRRGIVKAKNLTVKAGSMCVLFLQSFYKNSKDIFFTYYKSLKDYIILVNNGYKGYKIYQKIIVHTDNLQKLFITINELLNNELKEFIINLKGLNLQDAIYLDVNNLRNQEIYQNNPRCLEYFKKHPKEGMLNIVKLFLSLHTENIANIFKTQIEQISFILPILDNFINYNTLPITENTSAINSAINSNQLFTYYALELQKNINIDDLEIFLSLFLSIVLESRTDPTTLIFKLNTLLELVRIFYWKIKYNSEIQTNQKLSAKLTTHIEILKEKFKGMPELIKIISSKITDESFLLFNKMSKYFFINLLETNDSTIKEFLELLNLYSYFNNPINIDEPIQLINLQNILIGYLNNILKPIRKFANLGILDELINEITRLSTQVEIQSIPRITINSSQNGGSFKTFKNRLGTIFQNIIMSLKKKDATAKIGCVYTKDYVYNPTTNPFNIIGTDCGWQKFSENINIDKNNHTIFSIINNNNNDDNNNCPILSAIISTISIHGSGDEKFDKDIINLILKSFNENIYNSFYGIDCIINEAEIQMKRSPTNKRKSRSRSPRQSRSPSPSSIFSSYENLTKFNNTLRKKPNFFRKLFSKNTHKNTTPVNTLASADNNSDYSTNSYVAISPSKLETNNDFDKIDEQNIVTSDKNAKSLVKSKKIPYLDKILNIVGGIGLKHICDGLSLGKLSLETIGKFDDNLGKYLSFKGTLFSLRIVDIQEYIRQIIRCNIIYSIINGNIETLINELKIKYILLIENYNNVIKLKKEIETEKQIFESEYGKLNNTTKKMVSKKQNLQQITEYNTQIDEYTKQMKKLILQMQNEFNLIFNIISITPYTNKDEILNMFITPVEINPTILENLETINITNNMIDYKNIFYILKIFNNKLRKWVNYWYLNYNKINIINDESIPIIIKLSLLNYNLYINSPILQDLFQYSVIDKLFVCKETYELVSQASLAC